MLGRSGPTIPDHGVAKVLDYVCMFANSIGMLSLDRFWSLHAEISRSLFRSFAKGDRALSRGEPGLYTLFSLPGNLT